MDHTVSFVSATPTFVTLFVHIHQEYEEMTIAEIMMGKGSYFPGLIPLCYAYLDYIQCDKETR